MTDLPDFFDENYDPQTVMARVGHLPERAQRDIQRVGRILRAAFGYDEAEMPDHGRIISIALTGPCANLDANGGTIAGYDFRIMVNLPECADDAHWRFARRLIASEIGAHHPVTLAVDTSAESTGIILYDANADFPLNARELSFRP